MKPLSAQLRIASYNIHSGVGSDGRISLRRIVKVIREIDPDIIALQEVGDLQNEASGRRQFQALARLTGLQFVAGPTGPGYYGNAILSRIPAKSHDRTILNYRDREPRGMLQCELEWPSKRPHQRLTQALPEFIQSPLGRTPVEGRPGMIPSEANRGNLEAGYRIFVFSTHLGLRFKERWNQILRLVARIRRARKQKEGYYLLMGDFNVWWPLSVQLRYVEKKLDGHWKRDHTFPARFPFLSLDRFLQLQNIRFLSCGRHNSALAREASDHLPLVADIELLHS